MIKRIVNKIGKVKHIVLEDNNLVVGIFEPDDLITKLRKDGYSMRESLGLYALISDKYYKPLSKIQKKAVCKSPDEFNKNTGMDIVDLKILLNYHEKMERKYDRMIRILSGLINKLEESVSKEEYAIGYVKNELNKYQDNT